MKRLYILRHAKSSWAQPGLSDSDRPLNEKGNQQVEALSDWIKKAAQKPEKVLCSPAARTLQTYGGIQSSIGSAKLDVQKDLYIGLMEDYLDAIWRQTDQTIMIIGHNPTCDELTRYLTKPSSPAAEKLMAHHFGTATMAVLDFDGNEWIALSEASCSLQELIRPKELP